MYTVGLDADTLVSIQEVILVFIIKYKAGNSILNLSPPLLGKFFFIFIFIIVHIIKEKFVFSIRYNIKKYFYTISEVGKISKFFPFNNIFNISPTVPICIADGDGRFKNRNDIISAGYLLVLPWKNNINKDITNAIAFVMSLLIFNIFSLYFILFLNAFNSNYYIIKWDKNKYLIYSLESSPPALHTGAKSIIWMGWLNYYHLFFYFWLSLYFVVKLKIFHYYRQLLNSIIFLDKFIINSEKVELIKKYEHFRKHKRPNSEKDFGYYLAGLIEGDGYIGKRSIEIAFHINDISLAYYVKKRIGYGNVTKYSHTNNAVRYSVWNKEGLTYILNLVNGKFFAPYKNEQIRKFKHCDKLKIGILPSFIEQYPNDIFIQSQWLMENSWLCGFTDADGSFTIHFNPVKNNNLRRSLRLEYKIVQKHEEVILAVKKLFGGHSYFDGSVYRYRFASLKKQHILIDYFDKYQLNSSKYIRYLKWRKCYRLYLEGQHLLPDGMQKILNIVNSLRD